MKTCKAPNCERPSRTLELCTMHYSRFRRTGSTQHSRPAWDNKTIEERFWMKVQKTEHCWMWTGATQPSGHGRFLGEDRRTVSAYRWLWERLNGTVPDGMVLDHIACDTPGCVNPDHLQVTTIGVNVLRGDSPSAKHARQTHCIKGHPLSGENLRTVVRKSQGRGVERICRECANSRRRKQSDTSGS